jgi:hypothetical protein
VFEHGVARLERGLGHDLSDLELDGLQVGAAVAERLEAELLEAVGQVLRGALAAGLGRAAPLHLFGRERGGDFADGLDADAPERLALGGRQRRRALRGGGGRAALLRERGRRERREEEQRGDKSTPQDFGTTGWTHSVVLQFSELLRSCVYVARRRMVAAPDNFQPMNGE